MGEYTVVNGELYHYGVLGMKWGVRRAQRKSDRIDRKADRKNWSDDTRAVAKIKAKKVSEMSNAELKKLNERNQLEVTRRELKQKQNRGQRAVKTFISTAGTITAVTAAAAVYKKHGTQILEKIGHMTIGAMK